MALTHHPIFDKPLRSEAEAMKERLADRAEEWHSAAAQARCGDDTPRGETTAQRHERHADELDWALRRIAELEADLARRKTAAGYVPLY
jgi:hypothetical protein